MGRPRWRPHKYHMGTCQAPFDPRTVHIALDSHNSDLGSAHFPSAATFKIHVGWPLLHGIRWEAYFPSGPWELEVLRTNAFRTHTLRFPSYQTRDSVDEEHLPDLIAAAYLLAFVRSFFVSCGIPSWELGIDVDEASAISGRSRRIIFPVEAEQTVDPQAPRPSPAESETGADAVAQRTPLRSEKLRARTPSSPLHTGTPPFRTFPRTERRTSTLDLNEPTTHEPVDTRCLRFVEGARPSSGSWSSCAFPPSALPVTWVEN